MALVPAVGYQGISEVDKCDTEYRSVLEPLCELWTPLTHDSISGGQVSHLSRFTANSLTKWSFSSLNTPRTSRWYERCSANWVLVKLTSRGVKMW
jgi:hypothetical protein